ncbi:hypothetical protein E2C01_083324 [Portunus trituberculatus]|uniref:Uncharacterized protein n=1 Tax=Portunus trituberculatus TaxID=210409 RepID=A0A5B7IWW7_PORTR|nr:hypothetical protein [Portunus trituberculatus]
MVNTNTSTAAIKRVTLLSPRLTLLAAHHSLVRHPQTSRCSCTATDTKGYSHIHPTTEEDCLTGESSEIRRHTSTHAHTQHSNSRVLDADGRRVRS